MSKSNHDPLPDELRQVEDQLRASRVQASPLELDQIKLRAMNQASRKSAFKPLKGATMRSRVMTLLVSGVLLGGTTGGAIAWEGGGGEHHQRGGGHEEYCEQHPSAPECKEKHKHHHHHGEGNGEGDHHGDRGGGDHGDHHGDRGGRRR